jgi:hypothetical protein
MCLEDVMIGRASRAYSIATVLSAAVAVEIVPADKFRLTLIIGSPTSGTMFWSHDPNVGVLTGIPLPTAFPPIVLNVKDHGEIVTGAMFGIASAGTPSVTALMASFNPKEFANREGAR